MSGPAGPDRTDRSDEHERLPCGASSDDLLTQVAEGRGADRDAHQRDCLHCQAALGEFARSWGPMRELADLRVHAPPDLLARTLGGLRTRAVPDGRGRVDDEGETFQVAAQAVITVAGHVAHATEGVRAALSGIGALTRGPEATEGAAARVGISGRSVAIELTVAADYGQDLHSLAGRLRTRVVDAVGSQLGLDAVEIAVEITDVFLPRNRSAGVVENPRGAPTGR